MAASVFIPFISCVSQFSSSAYHDLTFSCDWVLEEFSYLTRFTGLVNEWNAGCRYSRI